MSSLRQLGSGMLYAVVSVVLVVGGLSLALAEGRINAPHPAEQPSATLVVPTTAASMTATQVSSPTAPIEAPIASATSRALIITATPVPPSPTTSFYASPRPTSTRIVYATRVPCGPYAGWLLSYTVQSGDTLFHISTLYRTTVQALQIANCKSSTIIFPGERLWVPNVPTITPGVTFIPTFPTSTAVPTEPLTLTPLPYTETAAPTSTSNPNP